MDHKVNIRVLAYPGVKDGLAYLFEEIGFQTLGRKQ
jgi:hypothetical protein